MSSTASPRSDDLRGPYFGAFGGRFVAESLMAALEELDETWQRLWHDDGFQKRLHDLFVNYAGRPSLLTEASRFAADLGGIPQDQQRAGTGVAHTGTGQDPYHR